MQKYYKVFDLKWVEHDEHQAVQNLLKQNKIRFYETPSPEFGEDNSAIYVSSKKDFTRARKLITQKQKGKNRPKDSKPNQKFEAFENRKKQAFVFALVLIVLIAYYIVFFKSYSL